MNNATKFIDEIAVILENADNLCAVFAEKIDVINNTYDCTSCVLDNKCSSIEKIKKFLNEK